MPELSMNAAQQGTPADVTKFAYANLAPRLSLGVPSGASRRRECGGKSDCLSSALRACGNQAVKIDRPCGTATYRRIIPPVSLNKLCVMSSRRIRPWIFDQAALELII
jgi:hypothetical protein